MALSDSATKVSASSSHERHAMSLAGIGKFDCDEGHVVVVGTLAEYGTGRRGQ